MTTLKDLTGRQCHNRIKQMRTEAGENVYARLALADQALKDRAWVEDVSGGGGDMDKAMTRLEEDGMDDICALVPLSSLLELFNAFPNLADWKKAKFNVPRLWADYKAKQKPERNGHSNGKPRVKDFVPVADFRELTPAAAWREYERSLRRIETNQEKITRLEAENEELRKENAELKQEIHRLKTTTRQMCAG